MRFKLWNSQKRIILALLSSLGAYSAHAYPAAVNYVTDGDTIQICPFGDADTTVDVRLYGIDAPEKRQEGGQEAAAYLRSILPQGAQVEVIERRSDKYGRAVALVYLDGRSVNAAMLRAGHAWMYRKYCKGRMCDHWEQLQDAAAADRKGLWKEAEPIPPWKWRKRNQPEE